MITNLRLARGGRLGNQMFQYAQLLGMKSKKGYEIVLDDEQKGYTMLNDSFDIKECVVLPKEEINIDNLQVFRENDHSYKENIWGCGDNTDFFGYFQTEKYFDHCEPLVRSEFKFKDSIMGRVENFLAPHRNNTLVSIHVRRTDYLYYVKVHNYVGMDFYQKAIKLFDGENTRFVIVSDDIPWCKENFIGDQFIFSTDDGNFDLCVQTVCDHHIITNSTFSWWGGWLGINPNRKVVAPSQWFAEKCEHISKDIVPDRWIRI